MILINPTRPDGQVTITLLFTIVAAFGEGFGPTRGTAPRSNASYDGGAVRILSPAVLAVAVGAVATIVASRFCSRPAMERGAR